MMRIHYAKNKKIDDWVAGRERSVGDLVTLVMVNDLTPRKQKYWYELHDKEGAVCNQDPSVRKHNGWTGTTNGLFRFAKGLFRIEKIEECKNGSEWIWLNEVSVEDDA